MHVRNADRRSLQTNGGVRRVDPVGRELEIFAAGALLSFDIRAANGEVNTTPPA